MEIGRHAVAVSLDVHGDAGLLAQPPPAIEQRDALLQPPGPHIGLQIDVIGAQLRYEIEHRLQVVDRSRIALSLPDHPVIAQEAGGLGGEGGIDEAHAGTAEASVADHLELRLQRPFGGVCATPLHGPERLQNAELLRHRIRLAPAAPIPRAANCRL